MARIGLIGAGHIGGTLARLFVQAGHQVAVSNSRGPQTLVDLVHELGEAAIAATPTEAAAFGDVVVVSVPLKNYKDVPAVGLRDKVVIDTNNYYPQRDGQIAALDDDSTTSSELLAEHLGDARVVKAFNQIRFDHLAERGRPAGTPGRLAIPIAGDDADAKKTVAELIDEIGFDAVDTGRLGAGRLFQPGATLYVGDVTADTIRAAVADR
jgi:8-hydroxy-5-deazaflavin:NADPH oxidoreductase